MSSIQSSSASSTSSDPEPPRRRPSIPSPIPPRHTISSSGYYRSAPPPTRTVSAGSQEWNESRLTSTHLSQIPSQAREQTVSEFLREDFRPQAMSGSEISAEARRQTIMAMDRKRRLTSSGHDGGRRRTTQGGFHDRHLSGQSFRLDGPSSPRQREWPERMESRDRHSSQVIDLTGSSPIATPAPLSSMPPPQILQGRSQQSLFPVQSRGSSSSSRRYTVPRWQPDSETSECPICGRTFGILFRRHHCRKCGRVVCNDCSPHRITIPRSLIVNPPGPGSSSSPVRPMVPSSGRVETVDLTGDDDEDETMASNLASRSFRSELEGGAKVRLCNPCVPDPQPEPQAEYSLPIQSSRPQSHGDMGTTFSSFLDRHAVNFSQPRHHTEHRQASGNQVNQGIHSSTTGNRPRPYGGSEYDPSHTAVQNALYGSSTRSEHHALPRRSDVTTTSSALLDDRYSRFQRFINAGMPPPPSSSSPTPPNFSTPFNHTRYQSLDSGNRPEVLGNRPRVRSMLDVDPNIQRMMGLASGPASPSSGPPRPRYRESDICPICRRLLPPRGADGDETDREAHIIECISARDPTTARSASARAEFMGQPPPRAPVQMVPFVATEKDCLGEDGSAQECSICMVEYDEGDQLARLECLCKFHKECIVSWFSRKQECPLHKVA